MTSPSTMASGPEIYWNGGEQTSWFNYSGIDCGRFRERWMLDAFRWLKSNDERYMTMYPRDRMNDQDFSDYFARACEDVRGFVHGFGIVCNFVLIVYVHSSTLESSPRGELTSNSSRNTLSTG